ncbi:hypothetical protein GGI05_003813 [Coemansia sp. RSA 2603]|nr:hypothetical protein GGI05_003813 [Coemansia sp. RSA 2603]
MADGSINETLPYLRHSASRSIGSRNANAGLSSSRSSSTLQTCASTKAQHLLVPVPARPSNGEFIVVQASGQKCEWKPCWDVI